MRTAKDIRDALLTMRDDGYRDFQSRLLPTVDKKTVIGVRVPQLRRLAKELSREERDAFLSALPHGSFDENCLHVYLVDLEKDYERTLSLVDAFLPYVDNWATCDGFAAKALATHPKETYKHILRWIASDRPYTVRFAIGLLLRYYLDEEFHERQLSLVAAVSSEEYYVQMMQGWYFATALAKQSEASFPYFTERRLSPTVHRMAVRKAIESYRIPDEIKKRLRAL